MKEGSSPRFKFGSGGVRVRALSSSIRHDSALRFKTRNGVASSGVRPFDAFFVGRGVVIMRPLS